MTKNTKSDKSTNQLLIEQIMTKVATISQNIEKRGQSIFGQGNLLTIDEINDYSLEFLELFVLLLQAGEKVDRRGSEDKEVRQFLRNFSQQSPHAGGNLREF